MGMKVSELGEFGLIERIAQRLPPYLDDVRVGVGDDVAVLKLDPETYQLATCDIQVEGIHFLRQWITPYQLGRRAAAINLSDIAAKGGVPQHFLISLALPPDTEVRWVDALYDGLREEASRYGADIVGGNMSKTEGPIVLDLFVLGQVRREEVLLRSGARPGDVVLVTGCLGEAAAGLALVRRPNLPVGKEDAARLRDAYLTPTPRIREGRAIASSRRASAMIDLSDGLSSDIGHICEKSHVGVRLWAECLPLSKPTRRVAELMGRPDWALALEGGEDYELCFIAPAEVEEVLASLVREATGTIVTCIGEVLPDEAGRWVQLADGEEVPLRAGGWDHFAAGEFACSNRRTMLRESGDISVQDGGRVSISEYLLYHVVSDGPEVTPISPLRFKLFQLCGHARELAHRRLAEVGDPLSVVEAAELAGHLPDFEDVGDEGYATALAAEFVFNQAEESLNLHVKARFLLDLAM